MRTRRLINPLLGVMALLFLVSCSAYKKIPYLEGAETLSEEQIKSTAILYEPKIMPNDILSIAVNTKTPGAARDFNLPLLPNGSEKVRPETYTDYTSSSGTLQNYLVDKSGNIEFPVLGRIEIAGLTRLELQDKLAALIYPTYINEKPIVNVRFLDFKVSVLGEVVKPGVYKSDNGVLTLFDALALAGDLTIYGKRDNIMLIRENDRGEVQAQRINLQDKDILLNKDIYYLQQNDKIIVDVNKARANSSAVGSVESISLTVASLLITIAALIIR